MSTLSEKKVQEIVEELRRYFGVRSIPQLAKRLGYSHKGIYKWIERKSIPGKKLTKLYPEFNLLYLETGEGTLLRDKKKANEKGSHSPDPAISEINDEIVRYAAHLESLKKVQLPADAALELLRSSIKLIQAYIDAVETAQNNQQDDS